MMYTLKFYEKSVDKISYYTVSFIREMQFIAIFPRPISQKVRTVLCTNEILDNGNTDQVVIGNIIIPSVTSTIYTKYITVEYVLELEVKLNVSATKFKAKIPIVIGTVPLRQSLDAQQDHLVEPIMVPNESGGVSMRYIISKLVIILICYMEYSVCLMWVLNVFQEHLPLKRLCE